MNEEDLLSLFISEGTAWVAAQRVKHRALGHPLAQQQREDLGEFFPAQLIEATVVNVVPELENPDFFTQLDAQGIPRPFDFREMAGITFVDTICIATSRLGESPLDRSALLFHECVHVVQYHLLGLNEFMRRYVAGWAENGRLYIQIPLEVHAYELEKSYRADPGKPLRVLPLVERQLGLAT